MEGGRICRVTIASSEIDPHSEVYLAASHDVVEEGKQRLDLLEEG